MCSNSENREVVNVSKEILSTSANIHQISTKHSGVIEIFHTGVRKFVPAYVDPPKLLKGLIWNYWKKKVSSVLNGTIWIFIDIFKLIERENIDLRKIVNFTKNFEKLELVSLTATLNNCFVQQLNSFDLTNILYNYIDKIKKW